MMRIPLYLVVLFGASLCQAIGVRQIDSAPSTTSHTSTACKTYAITATPTSDKCDIGGTLRHPKIIGKPSKLPSKASKTLVACRDRCLNNGQCLSFGVDHNTSECILYSVNLAGQGIQHPGKDSGTVHYDRSCFTSTCSVITTTTTTTSPVGTPGCGSVPAPTFGLIADGGSHNGLRGFLTGNDQIYNRQLQFTQYNSTPNQVFALDSACHLTNDNGIAHTYLNATQTDFIFDIAAHIAAATNPQQIPATCDTSSGYLTCSDQADNTLSLTTEAPQHIAIGPDVPEGGGYEAISLKVLFL